MGDLLPESTVGGQQILTEGSEIKQGPRGAGAEPWHVTLYTAEGQPVQVPIPVTLTGQNELIAQHLASTRLIDNPNGSVGETIGGSNITPVNVSRYAAKYVFVANNYDQDIFVRVRFFATHVAGIGNNYTIGISRDFRVKTGHTKLLTPTDIRLLAGPCVGISLFIFRDSVAPSVGSADFLFLGGPSVQLLDGPMSESPTHSRVTIGTTPVALPGSPLVGRKGLVIYNSGNETVYLGGPGVSVANGKPLPAGAEMTFGITGDDVQVFAVASSAGQELRIWEVR